MPWNQVNLGYQDLIVTWCNVLTLLILKNEVTAHIFWECCEDCRKKCMLHSAHIPLTLRTISALPSSLYLLARPPSCFWFIGIHLTYTHTHTHTHTHTRQSPWELMIPRVITSDQ